MMDESDVWDVTQIHFCCYVNFRAYVVLKLKISIPESIYFYVRGVILALSVN
jgi:hypothetical protein